MQKLLKKLPFYSHNWFQFLLFLLRHYYADKCPEKSSLLTYSTLHSIVPIVTVLLVVLSTFPRLSNVRVQIYDFIYRNLMPNSSIQISQYINEFAENSSHLTTIGIAILFVTTLMTLRTIERTFNQIWHVHIQDGLMLRIIRQLFMIITVPLILATAFIASGVIRSLSFLNQQVLGYSLNWLFTVQLISFAVTIAGFAIMYWYIPKTHVPFKNATIAAIIIAVLFEALKQGFGHVMSNFTNYEAIYGAFAALPIFLLWIYLSWNLILLGVEISYALTHFNPQHTSKQPSSIHKTNQ